jgi:amino acid adenylation domain-containing protein/non-ribosomal peptide synthase protein (TIGR01720 family)
MFELQAARTPDTAAIVFEEKILRYDELNFRANQVAHYLRLHRVRAEVRVAFCLERSPELIIALLGIVKAGGVCIALDPSYPSDRLSYIAADAEASVIVTNSRLLSRLPACFTRTICLDRDWELIAQCDTSNPLSIVNRQNLSYIIYTSGSTGRPKGVCIPHSGARSLALAQRRIFQLDERDAVLQFASICFDASTWEWLLALLSGARLVLARQESLTPGPALLQLLESVSVVTLPPTVLAALPWAELPALRTLVVAGEPCPRELAALWSQKRTMLNAYGPTETSVCATVSKPLNSDSVSLGEAIPGTEVYVLDAYMNPAAPGEIGEFYIAGEGLGRGYLKRADLTAERFIANPFGAPGSRMYRTGDLVKRLLDGKLEFIGRADRQVKLRGFRIELAEIEAVLAELPGVLQAAVNVFEQRENENRLAGYVLAMPGWILSAGDLRRQLTQKLPEYMIPSAIVVMKAFPVSPNGKLDREALPAPELNWAPRAEPRTDEESSLARLWAEVLNVPAVGIDDSFFELGGHSLLAGRVLTRVQNLFGIQLPISILFEAPTVREFAARMKSGPARASRFAIDVSSAPRLPVLSFAQERLWFLQKLLPGDTSYNLAILMRLHGDLNLEAMRRALDGIIQRHEVLRTRITEVDGRAMPAVEFASSVPWYETEPREQHQSEEELLNHIQTWAQRAAGMPFDLQQAPPIRAHMLRLGPLDFVFLLVAHHIAFDGWSNSILNRELNSFYNGFIEGEPPALPPLGMQYSDYAVWQRRHLAGRALDEGVDYWRCCLADLEPLELPTDHARPAVQKHRGAVASIVIEADLAAKLRQVSRGANVTLFMTLLAAFKILLHRYSGQSDLVIGMPVAGRDLEEAEALIGFFVNLVPLRTDLRENPRLVEVLKRVKQSALEAYAHQDVPFTKVIDALRLERDASRHPVFQIVFVMQNTPAALLEMKGLCATPIEFHNGTSRFDLTLSVSERDNGVLTGELEYDTDLYEADTARRITEHWRRLLQGMVTDSDACIGEMPMLNRAELNQVLSWGTPAAAVKTGTVVELFAQQVRERPQATAVICGEEKWSYAKLNQRSNRLAHWLRGAGIGTEIIVGVCLERSLELVQALLAILKTGAAYMPLDPEYPGYRLAFMIGDAGARLVLTTRQLRGVLPESVECVCLDELEKDVLTDQPVEDPEMELSPEDLAYVIYTSGTAGQPKGTLIPHRSIPGYFMDAGYANWEQQTILQHSSISWDPLTLELWSALSRGGTAVFHPEPLLRAGDIEKAVRRHDITLLWLPASLFASIVDESPEALAGVRQLLVGGEALSVPHVRKALEHLPDTQLINGYGPSECTVFSACFPIPATLPADLGSIPIGKPAGDRRLHVLDGHLQPVFTNIIGQLYVSGPAVAHGYLNQPALTAERFLPNPFSSEPGARMYCSGDLVRWLSNGILEFLGRADHQVKIRGFRIEPAEIELLLRAQEGVQDALVIAQPRKTGKRLAAYVRAMNGYSPEPGVLQERLRNLLPAYMIPVEWAIVNHWPRNVNGKLDRSALPETKRVQDAHARESLSWEEAELARIWAEVLTLERVGVDDNFFMLGGDSILSIQIVARARRWGMQITPRDIFEHQTVARLAASLKRESRTCVDQGPLAGRVELAPIQRWFFSKRLAVPSHFNQSILLVARCSLSPEAVRVAVRELQERHDVLRMSYAEHDGEWQQTCLPMAPNDVVAVEDLSAIPLEKKAAEIEERSAKWQQSLDLRNGPLMRVVLFQTGDETPARLLIVIHHLIVDAVSWTIFLDDLQCNLEQTFQEKRTDEKRDPAPPGSSYRQWTARLRDCSQASAMQSEREYWLKQASLMSARPRTMRIATLAEAGEIHAELTQQQSESLLRRVPAALGVRSLDILVAALALAFCRRGKPARTAIMLEGHGREDLFPELDISRTIGWFTALYPIVADLPAGASAPQAVKLVSKQLRAVPRGGIGYGLLRHLCSHDDIEIPAEISFNYLGQTDSLWSGQTVFSPAPERKGPERSSQEQLNFPVELEACVTGGKMLFSWIYDQNRYSGNEIRDLAADFSEILQELAGESRSAACPVPSDFPLAELDGHTLDRILQKVAQTRNK